MLQAFIIHNKLHKNLKNFFSSTEQLITFSQQPFNTPLPVPYPKNLS